MTTALVAIFLAVLVASVAQSVAGFGFSLISVPLISLVLSAKSAVVGTTGVGLLISLSVAVRQHDHVEWRSAGLLIAAAIAGMPLGLLVITQVPERDLQIAIAVTVLVFGALLWRGLTLRTDRLGAELGVGLTAGVLSTATGMSGPPLVIALQARHVQPAAFRATLAVIFTCSGLISLGLFVAAGRFDHDAGRVALAGLPAMVLGVIGGERVFRRIDPSRFRALVLALLALSGTLALIGALT